MKTRVFVSLGIPRNVKEEIKEIQEQLPEFEGKKTETENLHLTLKFLGWLDDEMIEKARKKLREIKPGRFEAETGEIGTFSPQALRIIWLHLANCEKLQEKADNALSGMFEKESRFMSHITIARVKKARDKRKFIEELSKIKANRIKFNVEKFFMMKSQLKKSGPAYSVIEEFPLE
jgi:2'-5' RNA ligase